MEQSVESNFFKKFKAIASLPILRPYFSFFFKERFFRKSSKPGHGNLVLITSTVQVELSKLNFNFIDITNIFYIVFQVLKVLLIKYCKIQSLDPSFLVVFISFYISRYHFSQVFRTSFNIIWKKIFVTNFFFNRFTETPYPLKNQNLLSMTKVFCQCSLTYHGFSRLLCYDDARKN